jgi:hypothetical protein
LRLHRHGVAPLLFWSTKSTTQLAALRSTRDGVH